MAEILFLSHTARNGDFRVGSHHLSYALAQDGHAVAHISTPYSWAHRIIRPRQRSRRVAAAQGATTVGGVVDLVPHTVLPAAIWWSETQMLRALGEVGLQDPEFVFIDQPLLSTRAFMDATTVFRPTDLFRTAALKRAARRAIRRAHGVAATSPGVLASLLVGPDQPSCILENGVDFFRFFAASGAQKRYDFVYVGALDYRFDFGAVARAAARLPRSSFAIYGPKPRSLPGMPKNVRLAGPIPYEDAPAAMAAGRIGIMPFVPNESNSARSPMKLYEYVAAGIPVVAPMNLAARVSHLAGIQSFDPNDPDGFARALQYASHALVLGDQDSAIARSKDWSLIAQRLLAFAVSADFRRQTRGVAGE